MRGKAKLLKGLQAATVVICVGLFVVNVFGTALSFFNNATVVFSTTQITNARLPLPAFLVCNGSPYQRVGNGNTSNWDERVYMSSTRDPEDFEVTVQIPVNGVGKDMDPKLYSRKVLNTVYHGRCLFIKFKDMVGLEIILFRLLCFHIFFLGQAKSFWHLDKEQSRNQHPHHAP